MTRRSFLAGFGAVAAAAGALAPARRLLPGAAAASSAVTETVSDEEAPLAPSEPEDAAVSALAAAYASCEPYVDLSALGLTRDQVAEAYRSLKRAHPSAFYADGLTVSYDPATGLAISARLGYLFDGEELAAAISDYESAAAEALAWADGCGTDACRAKALHDYLAVNCSYDEEAAAAGHASAPSSCAYGALVSRVAVCEGYAQAYRDLLGRLGIPSCIVESEAMNHSWNQVYADGAWRHADVTRDDAAGRLFLKSDSRMIDAGYEGWSGGHECPDKSLDHAAWEVHGAEAVG